MEAVLRFSLIIRRLSQEEFAFEAIEFWFIPAFSCGVHDCQCFRERCESCLWLSYRSMYFGEERRKI